MSPKLEDHHRQRPAYVYVRQSTIAQVRQHQESTERQYALRDKAIAMGWSADMVRILDGDLGVSGALATNRQDFKTLAADVSMGKVGAVLALEASRLARSCLDWQRLLELCALTRTLVKKVSTGGDIQCRITHVPRDSWEVLIKDHHEGYISWEEFLTNQETLERNRTYDKESVLTGPSREGLALLQGLLICARCGRRLTVTYTGSGGIYPTYNCHESKREGIAPEHRVVVRCEVLDAPVSERVLEALVPAQLDLAVEAVKELEQRDDMVMRHWRMRLERADYEAQLAQKRYEEVDPSNRLVAGTLETRWNDKLLELGRVREQFAEFEKKHARVATREQKAEVLALAEDFPRLWNAPTTQAKDRKRMLRLLIKDITVERSAQTRQVLLHIRWQGGACEQLTVDLPPRYYCPESYSDEVVEKVRSLAQSRTDREVAEALNRQGLRSITGRPFSRGIIRWIRTAHDASTRDERQPHELTVDEVAEKFGVHHNTVCGWIEQGLVEARRRTRASRHWVMITPEKERELRSVIPARRARASQLQRGMAREQEGGAV